MLFTLPLFRPLNQSCDDSILCRPTDHLQHRFREQLDLDLMSVRIPQIEDIAQELSVSFRRYRIFAGDSTLVVDDRDKLDPAGIKGFKRFVDLSGMSGCFPGDRTKQIDIKPGSDHFLTVLIDLVESRLPTGSPSLSIMQLLIAVDAQSDIKMVILHKFDPFIIDQITVGLQAVPDLVIMNVVLLFQFDGFLEEIETG